MKGKLEIILFVVIILCLLVACGNFSTNLSDDSASTVEETNSVENNGGEKYDKIVSVVDSYWKAKLDRDINKATSYCANFLKSKVRKDITQINEEFEAFKSELMDVVIISAQDVFYYTDDYKDIIDAEYLRNDDDMQKAINEFAEFATANGVIWSLPEKAEMLSDKKAIVKTKIYTKDIPGNETSFVDGIKDYLHGIVLDKLLDNSNFIKKQIVKKVVKEEILYGIKNYKKKYEEGTDKVLTAKNTYHLKKKKGNWIIIKIDKEAADS